MLEQTARLVTFENTVDGTILRFGPLGNKSHQKKLLAEIEAKSTENFIKPNNTEIKLSPEEIKEYFYNEAFPTLDNMNILGWKLESFAIIYDSSELRLQVAIFSRETN